MRIKKTLQSETWDRFLRQEAEAGNEDVIEILQVDQKEQVAPLSTTSTTKAQLENLHPPIVVINKHNSQFFRLSVQA